jgi:uncharacterized RDD family membrane protein YckC
MFSILGADGKEYGPVPAAKIHEWIAGGRASLQTQARRQGETDWKPLGDFAEFNASVAPIAVPGAPAAAPGLTVPVAPVPSAESLVLASRWARLGAVILDSIIGAVVMAPGFVLLVMAGALANNANDANPALALAGIMACGIGGLVIFGIQIFMLVKYGQTIAKKLLGIRIVTYPEGASPGFVKVILLRIVVNGLIGAVPFLGFIYTLIDACFIFGADRRCVHDHIAGTQVVKA